MKTKITKTEALFVQFLLAFLLSLHVNAVDPVEFLISKTFIENKTLVPLPQNFQYKGDTVTDCCTLQILVTSQVTEYEEPGPEEGSGIEPSKATESQPETGEITFQFYHPNIRDEDLSFIVAVSEKDESPKRHVLQFDKCLAIELKTFNFSAASTMATMKDVKMVIVSGKDENIVCTYTNATTTMLYTNQNETATKPPVVIVQNANISLWVPLLVISWLIIVILVGLCYKLYRRNEALTRQTMGSSESAQMSDLVHVVEKNQTLEESEAPNEETVLAEPGDSKSDSDIERHKEDETKSISRNITRGGRPGASNPLLTEEQGDPANSQWISKICKNKPLLVMAVFTCVWFIGCVIATGIIVPSLL